MIAACCLLFFLPFLLSLFGRAPMPMLLCFVASVLAMLLSVELYAAVLPWALGMAIAVISVRERIHAARQLRIKTRRDSSRRAQLLNSLVQG
jgi:hypothetical protein